MKKLRGYSAAILKEYFSLRSFASLYVQREIRYERVKRLRRYDGKPTGVACVDCKRRANSYDHRDYFEPGKIEPVCQRCNVRRGPATKTLDRLVNGETFTDPRNLWELTPRALRNRGEL